MIVDSVSLANFGAFQPCLIPPQQPPASQPSGVDAIHNTNIFLAYECDIGAS